MEFFVDLDKADRWTLDCTISSVWKELAPTKVEVYCTSGTEGPGENNYCLKVFGAARDFDGVVSYLMTLKSVDQYYLRFTSAKGEFNRRVTHRISSDGTVRPEPVLVSVIDKENDRHDVRRN